MEYCEGCGKLECETILRSDGDEVSLCPTCGDYFPSETERKWFDDCYQEVNLSEIAQHYRDVAADNLKTAERIEARIAARRLSMANT